MLVTLVKIYVDEDPHEGGLPYQVVVFADAGKAEDFAREIYPNDALMGISAVEIEIVRTDDGAVEDFWTELNKSL